MRSLGRKATGARLERMKASPRWVRGSFQNVHPAIPGLRNLRALPLLEFFCRRAERQPLARLPTVDPGPMWSTPPGSGFRVTWLGHSTLLFELDGVRLLTDPVWGPRASPSKRAGPKRFQPPVVPLDALPPLEAILISHDHYDHLDYPTIRDLTASAVPFITPLGVGAHLESWGIAPERITELDWWETTVVGDVTVTATPAQHFSGRGPHSRNHTLWSSWVLEGPSHRVFHGADTGLTREYESIRARFGAFDLVLLEIGAYHPAWGDIHLGPHNAVEAWKMAGGGPLLPIHWGTFDLAVHRWDQPIETLLSLAPEAGIPLIVPRFGQPVEPGRVDGVEPWWREVAALHGPTRDVSPDEAAAAADLQPAD